MSASEPRQRSALAVILVHAGRGIFQCFGCKARGNVLEFAALMERVDPENGAALRSVALKLQKEFFPEGASGTAPSTPSSPSKSGRPVKVNEPIDFELKGLDPSHPYLQGRGFSLLTLDHFGVGFCERGYFKDRIAIPIHDPEGRLVWYASKLPGDGGVTRENPKYLFPERRERGGAVLEFDRSRLLYNAHRVKKPVDDLVVVAGFLSVWWLSQHGFPAAVATMSPDASEAQAEEIAKLVKMGGRVWVAPSADGVGSKFAARLLELVAPYRLVRWARLEEGKKPTGLSGDELKALFAQ